MNTIKDGFKCVGCENFLDKSQIKNIQNFEDFYACEDCFEVYCS